MLLTVLTVIALPSLIITSAHAYIDHFDLFDATTNEKIRPLLGFDVITTKSPFTIVADTGGEIPKHVTFISRFYERVFSPPYALGGDKPKGNFRPAKLPPGKHVIHALTDNTTSDTRRK